MWRKPTNYNPMNINRTELIEAIEAKFNDANLSSTIRLDGLLNLEDPIKRSVYNIVKEETRDAITDFIKDFPSTEPKLPTVEQLESIVMNQKVNYIHYNPRDLPYETLVAQAVLTLLESLTKQPE